MRFTAYDMFDRVALSLLVREDDPAAALDPEWRVLVSASVAGHGEDDPATWARDALVAVLEHL